MSSSYCVLMCFLFLILYLYLLLSYLIVVSASRSAFASHPCRSIAARSQAPRHCSSYTCDVGFKCQVMEDRFQLFNIVSIFFQTKPPDTYVYHTATADPPPGRLRLTPTTPCCFGHWFVVFGVVGFWGLDFHQDFVSALWAARSVTAMLPELGGGGVS